MFTVAIFSSKNDLSNIIKISSLYSKYIFVFPRIDWGVWQIYVLSIKILDSIWNDNHSVLSILLDSLGIQKFDVVLRIFKKQKSWVWNSSQ